MTETPKHEFKNTENGIDAIIHANTWANERYPQMFGPKTLMTGDMLLSQLLGGNITAEEFMSHKLSAETTAQQLALVNNVHTAYGQYELAQQHITYTWDKDRYDTLRALKIFIPNTYAVREKSSIAYIDNPKNSALLKRIPNLFNSGALALKKRETLEKAQVYRETLRDFQKRKQEKQLEWTDQEKEELQRNWRIFSDYLLNILTTAMTESNSKLDKPFNDEVIWPFLQEIAHRGTRVVARTKDYWY